MARIQRSAHALSDQPHIQSHFTTGSETFSGEALVRLQAATFWSCLHCIISVSSALTVVAAASLSSPASAHPQKQRHGHEKQKVYNRGFQKGYNRAIKQVRYRPYYVPQKVYKRNFKRVVKDAYRPYYAPQRFYSQRPIVVARHPGEHHGD